MSTEREINEIRGRIKIAMATGADLDAFLQYVDQLENLVEEASEDDFYGTEGWRHRMGWD